MSDIHFGEFWRMDWGLGNPNKTAALIAMLMVAVWLLATVRKWGFGAALVLFTGLGICLIHTFSRGGLLAAAAGLSVLVWQAARPWPRRRMVAIGCSVWVIVGFSIFVQAHERYGQGLEDRSISNRFVLWKAAPAMMVGAPGGWGLGQSGKAYTDWYQPLDQSESYRTLVNSHLTWLVEFGWIGRFFYIFGWTAVILLCLPTTGNRWFAVALGIWVAFFTGSFFSSVAESVWLWVVPVLALAWVLVWRARNHAWPGAKWLVLPPATSGLLCLAVFAVRSPVTKRGNVIVVGRGEPGTWVVVDRKVLGHSRPLRAALATRPNFSCGLVEKFDDLPDTGIASLVVSGGGGGNGGGGSEKKMKSVKSLILVNPAFKFPVPEGAEVRVLIGEFSQGASGWSNVGGVERLPGVGDFIPDWPEIVFPPR